MAVAIQSNGTPGASNGGASTATLTFNNASGDRVIGMFTICADGASPTVNSATYPDAGAVAMAKITSNPGVNADVALFEKVGAATGSNSMKVTYSTTGIGNISAFSVTGSHASTASTAATVGSTTGTSLAITKTTTSGNGYCAAFVSGDNTMTITDTQVLLQNINSANSGNNGAGAYQNATGGSDVITMTQTNSDQIRGCGMEIPAAAGGPGPDTPSVTDALTISEVASPNLRSFINVTE